MNLCTLPVADGGMVEWAAGGHWTVNEAREVVVGGLRPEALELAPDGVAARVEVVEELGADAYAFCTAELAGRQTRLVARADAHHPPATASGEPAGARRGGAPLRRRERRPARLARELAVVADDGRRERRESCAVACRERGERS